MFSAIRRFGLNRNGSTAVEYSLIVAMITISATVAFSVLGGTLNELIGEVSGTVSIIIEAVPDLG